MDEKPMRGTRVSIEALQAMIEDYLSHIGLPVSSTDWVIAYMLDHNLQMYYKDSKVEFPKPEELLKNKQ